MSATSDLRSSNNIVVVFVVGFKYNLKNVSTNFSEVRSFRRQILGSVDWYLLRFLKSGISIIWSLMIGLKKKHLKLHEKQQQI